MSMYKSLVYIEVDIVSALTSVRKGGAGHNNTCSHNNTRLATAAAPLESVAEAAAELQRSRNELSPSCGTRSEPPIRQLS